MVNKLRSNLVLLIRNRIGVYPNIFLPIFGWHEKHPIKSSSDICIEGFMSSANTYFAYCFEKSNTVNLAHHTHLFAQVKRATYYKIPTVILVRNPIDAIASIKCRKPLLSTNYLIKYYITFYRNILTLPTELFITAKFTTVILNYNQVIDQLNQQFNTSFKTHASLDDMKDEYLTWAHDGIKPSKRREINKNTLKLDLKRKSSMHAAMHIYNKIINLPNII
jgi:hypothetical protein